MISTFKFKTPFGVFLFDFFFGLDYFEISLKVKKEGMNVVGTKATSSEMNSRFERIFRKDGKQLILVCARDGGVIQLKELGKENFLTIDLTWDGEISISTCMTFPRSKLDIEKINIHNEGNYDEIVLRATL